MKGKEKESMGKLCNVIVKFTREYNHNRNLNLKYTNSIKSFWLSNWASERKKERKRERKGENSSFAAFVRKLVRLINHAERSMIGRRFYSSMLSQARVVPDQRLLYFFLFRHRFYLLVSSMRIADIIQCIVIIGFNAHY